MTSILELRSVRGTGGGPDKTILHGATLHDPARFAVTVCYLRDDRDPIFDIDRRARAMGLNYLEVRERHSFDRRIWSQLRAVVADRRIDVVHGHDHKTNLLAYLLGRRAGVRALATAHNWSGTTVREEYVYYPADRIVLARLPRVIAVSSAVRERLIRAGARPDRVTVLLNGIDAGLFQRDAARRTRIRQELGIPDGVSVIGGVGRLEPEKRFDRLIEAFADVNRDWRQTVLVLAGDGSERTRLEAQAARIGLGTSVRFLGHRSDVAGLQDALDVFVQASEREGAPNAVLEAMAMETPVVATDVGGTSEVARPDVDALIVPAKSAMALTTAIRQVLADPASAWRRAIAARSRVERELSFAERTRRLEGIYDELLIDRDPVGVAPAPRRAGASGA